MTPVSLERHRQLVRRVAMLESLFGGDMQVKGIVAENRRLMRRLAAMEEIFRGDTQVKDMAVAGNPVPTEDWFYIQDDIGKLPLDGRVDVGILRLASDYDEMSAYRTGSFTAARGWHYHVDLATAGADVTVTFPASAVGGDRFRVEVAADDLTNGYAVKWNRNGHNMRSGTDDDPYWLFIEGEYAEWVYSGNATYGWGLVDGRIPHMGVLYRATGSSDTHLTNAAWSTAKLNTVQFDNASIADTANNKFTIKRSNVYRAGGSVGITTYAANHMTCRIGLGNTYYRGMHIYQTSGDLMIVSNVTGQSDMTISSPDIVIQVYHTAGSNRNLLGDSAGPEHLSYLCVSECLA